MADDPKDVALALLLGWVANTHNTPVWEWQRPRVEQEMGRGPIATGQLRLYSPSARAAVAYDTTKE